MAKIKKYQPGGNITGNIPKSVKVDTAGTIKKMRKAVGLPPLKTPSGKKDVDLSAPGKGMIEQLKKKGSMPASKTNIGKRGIKVKAKNGKSFPDLNKDGKITKADILKGRGVIKNGGKMKAKGGAALKKQAATAIAMKKAGKLPKKMMMGGKCRGGCY